ncbi:retinoic acid induced 16-like family protein [Aspergillus niger]|uniref:Uncharacterized protein n=2 Tax=Aspergillus niger TaxID=5061 RepID=A2QBW4_ASPNC|nr:hypothetical protein An02g01440 [Aspergillus niger]GJP90982.1 retinoic acid induced 16-like family protein [Aspergillus niger]CAK96361.1 hypothetical protein An02g01440 [Aspergillus niger]
MSTTDHTIAELIPMCKLAFQKCLTFPALYNHEWAQHCLLDFNHWVYQIGPILISSQSSDSQGDIVQTDKAKDALLSLHQSLLACAQCAEAGGSCREAIRNVDSALESMVTVGKEVQQREIELRDIEGRIICCGLIELAYGIT